ncbi:hypothetical protein LNN35_21820 [Pseudomonas stutzeri]|jgi:hypothetical protein|uniref:hypothetical protein n=1 Tax=Stutzerimonas stutzeri TaxID=316 RepID=UPI001E38AB54|nr:hypothetical protein [Stutzerimonas stutzeri]MCC8345405.1 hypothetical protein [Stutzerimonas stutzeri]
MNNRYVPTTTDVRFEAWFLAEAALRMKARSLRSDQVSHVRELVGEELWEQLGVKGNLFGKHVAKNLPYFSLEFDRFQGTRSMYRRREDSSE